ETIRRAEKELNLRFEGKVVVNRDLNRKLVSFQANKRQNGYRWFKYKEGFSAALIAYILDRLSMDSGQFLDPFAGSGAALIGAAKHGMDAFGIELLPVGCQIIQARKYAGTAEAPFIAEAFSRWIIEKPWQRAKTAVPFSHLRITAGAFPHDTEVSLGKYVST